METLQERHGIVSAGDVRRILNTDNSEIKDLCKQLKVYPKRDKRTGKAFFMREDVEFLKRMKELHSQSSQYREIDANPLRYPSLPVQNPIATEASTTMLVINFRKQIRRVRRSSC